MKLVNSLDLSKNQILNAVLQNLATAPSTPLAGQIYFDTALGQFGHFNGSVWVYLSSVTGNVSKGANAGAINTLQVSAGADKTIQDFISAGGILKVSSTGVVSIASAGTDYVTAISANSFTNKTFDANGVGNSIVNLETADFAINVIDTDTTLSANSDTRLSSQKAVRAFIASQIAGVAKPMGGIDCSTNPNYPAATVGDFYRVTVAGLIGGASGVNVEIGDQVHCFVTTALGSHATVGANWTIVQANVSQATATLIGLVALATQAEAEAKTNGTKALVASNLVNFTQKKIATIGDGTATSIVVTDGLNTIEKMAEIRDATSNQKVLVDITYALNTTTFIFGFAPALNSYKVVIIG